MKKLLILTIIGIALFATLPANAVEFEGSVGAVSNYIWRGTTQSAGNPAIQASVGLTTEKGFYVNAWGSQVDYNDDTTAEIDLTAGFGNTIGDTNISYDVGYIRYSYTGDDLEWGDDAQEVYGTLGLGPISGTIYRDIDMDTNFYVGAVSVSDIVDMPIDLSAYISRNDASDLGAGVTVGKTFKSFDVSYSYIWNERDDEDSNHSVGLSYNF
jgi:uncharacterized protein (TIGR02001 family)|tara:strand:- start:923 stop:1558 length:636 start_codon:yes stop_codon:yes gene_type:complete